MQLLHGGMVIKRIDTRQHQHALKHTVPHVPRVVAVDTGNDRGAAISRPGSSVTNSNKLASTLHGKCLDPSSSGAAPATTAAMQPLLVARLAAATAV
jgi:hypothetical protein